MRAVLQRVSGASVTIDGAQSRFIGPGFVILLGVTDTDDEKTAEQLAQKIAAVSYTHLRWSASFRKACWTKTAISSLARAAQAPIRTGS